MTESLFTWDLCVALAAGAFAVYLLLPAEVDPQPHKSRQLAALFAAIAVLLLSVSVGGRVAWWHALGSTPVVTTILFWLLAISGVIAAAATITAATTLRAVQAFCMLLASNTGLFLMFGAALLSAATLASLSALWLLARLLPKRWPVLCSEEPQAGRCHEPFIVCVAGTLLCVTLVGTIHHSLRTESRRTERNPRLSATPSLELIDAMVSPITRERRSSSPRVAGDPPAGRLRRDVVAAGISGALLLVGVVGAVSVLRCPPRADQSPASTSEPL